MMFGKGSKVEESALTGTIIGEGIRLEAALFSGTGSIRIDGEFKGDMDIDGSVIIGETGHVTGNIKAKYTLLAGTVMGNTFCSGTMHMASSGRMTGNIEANSVVVDEGANFNGACNMTAGVGIGSHVGLVKQFDEEYDS